MLLYRVKYRYREDVLQEFGAEQLELWPSSVLSCRLVWSMRYMITAAEAIETDRPELIDIALRVMVQEFGAVPADGLPSSR